MVFLIQHRTAVLPKIFAPWMGDSWGCYTVHKEFHMHKKKRKRSWALVSYPCCHFAKKNVIYTYLHKCNTSTTFLQQWGRPYILIKCLLVTINLQVGLQLKLVKLKRIQIHNPILMHIMRGNAKLNEIAKILL